MVMKIVHAIEDTESKGILQSCHHSQFMLLAEQSMHPACSLGVCD